MAEALIYNKALSYAYRLFNYRPRSRKELQERLKIQGYDSAIIDKVVSKFRQQGLINEERFARFWATNRIQTKPFSLTRIRQQLSEKGISPEIIDNVLSPLKEDFNEYEIAKSLAEKRLRLLSGVKKIKAKKRLFDYLKRRGFSYDMIYKVLSEIYG